MGLISASVGRGGANQPRDVRLIQELLDKHIKPPMPPLKADGLVGPKTIAAIEDFQRRVVKLSRPDGRVDPGARTFAALSASASGTPTKPSPTPTKPPPTPTSTSTSLPTGGGGGGLTEADLQRAADALKCEVACIKAVNEVESGGSGFLPSGRPKILFEAHVFSRRTKHRYDASYPEISSPTWNRALYKGGEKEYERLEKAMALDRQAALESASWGRFQIMGFNHQSAGYGSVEAYVQDMYQSEGKQLDAFVLFLQHQNLAAPLREKRWADFAKGYNGAGYAANKYDQKLKSAYEKHSQ